MPKFVIERQYLVPMYQHIVVEAETLDAACTRAISDDIDWDSQEMDCDSARATTITAVKIVPERYEADQAHHLIIASRDPKGLPLDMLSLAAFLYEDESKTGPRLEIPAKFTDDKSPPTPPRQQLRGLMALEPSGIATCRDASETQTRCPACPLSELCGARGAAQQFNPWAPPTKARLPRPCTQTRVGAEASGAGNPPLLT